MFDGGAGEDEVREEMSEVWELSGEEAVKVTLAGGAGALAPLPGHASGCSAAPVRPEGMDGSK